MSLRAKITLAYSIDLPDAPLAMSYRV